MNLYLRQDFHDTGPHLVKKVSRARRLARLDWASC